MSSKPAMSMSENTSLDPNATVDTILQWIALRPPRWASQYAVHLTPLQSPPFLSALQAFLDLLDPASREPVTRALDAGQAVMQPLDHPRLLSTLTIQALSGAAKNLERLMDLTWPNRPSGRDPATTSREQVDSLLLFTILAIERNWIYPIDVTDSDAAQPNYPKEYFFRIHSLIERLQRFDWQPAFAKLPPPVTLADLSQRLPLLRLRLIAHYALGRFLHDAALLRAIPGSVQARSHLNNFVIDFAHYHAIQTALGDADSRDRRIYATMAAECVEMLAELQMQDKSKVFPVDYIATSQFLKDNRLASKVARAGAFDNLITQPTGYMFKPAPLIRFKRTPEASEDLLELPHPIHFFIDSIAKDIPLGVGYIDFTVAAGGVHMIAATATGRFGASTTRRSLQGRVRNFMSGQVHQLRRCTTPAVDPQILPPRDGSPPAEAVWIETALTYGFQLNKAGQWLPFQGDVQTYISRNEWQADLRGLFDALFEKLLPTLDAHGITHLVINPDRSLNLLPFALLRDGDGNRLFDRRTISLVPTLPHFINALLRGNLRPDRAWNRVLILADTHSKAAHFALETRLVGSVFSGRDVQIHTTENFDEPSFIRDAEKADIIHICTHAAFDARKPHESGIDIGHDRWFDLAGIAKPKLQRHSIIFLSACETGTLDVSDRFNRASIAQVFLDAGAGSVIATQWKVDGRAMALLSSRFYEHLLQPDCPTTLEALRRAQDWLRTCPTSEASTVLGRKLLTTLDVPYANDFFWGSVMLWGCWV